MVRRKSTKVKNVKPREYAGIAYKSSLEAYCAQALTQAGLPVNYEVISFPILDAFTCNSMCMEFKLKKGKGYPKTVNTFEVVTSRVPAAKYTPDFTDMDAGWVVEVKGVRDTAYSMRHKLFRAYLLRNGLSLRIYVPNTKEQIDAAVAHILSTNSPCSPKKA